MTKGTKWDMAPFKLFNTLLFNKILLHICTSFNKQEVQKQPEAIQNVSHDQEDEIGTWRQFTSDTSFHGVRYIFNSKFKMRQWVDF